MSRRLLLLPRVGLGFRSLRRLLALVCAVLVLLSPRVAGPSLAADPPPSSHLVVDPLHYVDLAREHLKQLKPPEIVEMLLAIANGSDMGPGDGWFHPSLSRYSWEWLRKRYDRDRNGKISREEFTGPTLLFERLDRNHDGVLTSADFDWSERSLYAMQGMPAGFWFRSIDSNSNGRISADEWQAFFKKMAKGKDYLTPQDLREALPITPPPRPPGPPPSSSGPSPLVLLHGLMIGELGSFFEGPRIDNRAPDFALPTQDGKQFINMSKYRGNKPLVLVFGSFT